MIRGKKNPVKRNVGPQRASRACQKAMREAADIASDAREQIEAIARAHYEACESCQALASEAQIRRLQYEANEQMECGGVY